MKKVLSHVEKIIGGGVVQSKIWNNMVLDSTPVEYKTVSFGRRYCNHNGVWKSTNSFRVKDIPKVVATLQKSFEYILN